MYLKTLGIGEWTVFNWRNKVAPVFKGNNKESHSLKPKEITSKPFKLERQKSLPTMELDYYTTST